MEMDEVRLYTMATVVDASKFMTEWESRKWQTPAARTHAGVRCARALHSWALRVRAIIARAARL